ncbi:hypothetical protein JCM10450v2_005780 [Rhodotorula kratochvilovae]
MFRSLVRAFSRARSTAARPASEAAPTASSAAPRGGAPSAAHTPQKPAGAADATLSSSSAASPPAQQKKPSPAPRSPTDPAADYQRRLEERFGGAEASALGTLVDGKPEGLAAHVKRNMFRVI